MNTPRKLLAIWVAVVTLVIVATVGAFAGAKLVEGNIHSFVVDIVQSVPVEITAPIELDDGEIVTVSAPITVTIELRVSVDGNGEAKVIEESVQEPTITVTDTVTEITDTVEGGTARLDDLGIPYTLEMDSDDYIITEWVAFVDTNEQFNIAGELTLAYDAQLFQDVVAEVSFYNARNELIERNDIVNVDFRLKVDGYSRFSNRFPIFVKDIDHYAVQFKTVR